MNMIAHTFFPRKLLVFLLAIFLTSGTFADAPFKVGVVLPLSGMVAPMGQAVLHGLELYQKQHANELHSISFIIEDSKYDGKETSNVINKLISTDKVDMITVWGVTPSEIAAPIVNQRKVPTILATYLTLSSRFPYVVEIGPSEESELDPLVNFVKNSNADAHDFGAVTLDIGSAMSVLNAIDSKTGITMPREVIPNDVTDFKSIITKFKSKNIKRVMLFLFPEQALTFLRQAKSLSYEVSILGGDIFADENFYTEAKKLASGVYIYYGQIAPWLKNKHFEAYHNNSYLSEVGYGYSFGKLATELEKKKAAFKAQPFHTIISLMPITELPLSQPKIEQSNGKGLRILTSYEVFKP